MKELEAQKKAQAAPAKKGLLLLETEKEDYSKPGTLPFKKLWGPKVKYSDQIANGDKDDDKEVEDEDDLADPIVDDTGFQHKWKMDPRAVKEWGRRKNPKQNWSLVQQKGEDYSKPGTLPFKKLWGPNRKYSDQLANGDRDDDKEVEDEDDLADPIADDNGFQHAWKLNPNSLKEWGRRANIHENTQTKKKAKAAPAKKAPAKKAAAKKKSLA